MSESGRRKKALAERRAAGGYVEPAADGSFSLRELQGVFCRYEQRDDGIFHVEVQTISEAQGVRFLCPLCFAKNLGAVGTHGIVCWSRSRGVPDDARPGKGRWKLDGTSIDDLTLNADPPETARSVQLNGGCKWHGFVTRGRAK